MNGYNSGLWPVTALFIGLELGVHRGIQISACKSVLPRQDSHHWRLLVHSHRGARAALCSAWSIHLGRRARKTRRTSKICILRKQANSCSSLGLSQPGLLHGKGLNRSRGVFVILSPSAVLIELSKSNCLIVLKAYVPACTYSLYVLTDISLDGSQGSWLAFWR